VGLLLLILNGNIDVSDKYDATPGECPVLRHNEKCT
jgi:hypothetical protein